LTLQSKSFSFCGLIFRSGPQNRLIEGTSKANYGQRKIAPVQKKQSSTKVLGMKMLEITLLG